ncbi:MAG: methanethiol S-methyltransferase [Polyangiaceae bacterium]
MTRVLFFVYALVAYIIFLGTFLYAVGFIGDFVVPTRLDGPAREPLAIALAVNVGLLALFALQHSIMARPWFKERWTRIVPAPIERATYVLFSSAALGLLLWQWEPMGGVIWSVEDPIGRLAFHALFAFGWCLLLAATFAINHFDLFGLRQAWLHLRGRPYTQLTFATPRLYRIVRHPLYVGWLFTFWMTPTMTLAHLVFAIATTVYILVAIRFEERDLIALHGADYERYRQEVPSLVPFIGKKPRFSRRALM